MWQSYQILQLRLIALETQNLCISAFNGVTMFFYVTLSTKQEANSN